MKKPTLDLRAKIFLGSFFLVIPLGIALGFVWSYGMGQIGAARQELLGLQVTQPLLDVVFEWEAMGPEGSPTAQMATDWKLFEDRATAAAGSLAYTETGFATEGRAWTSPDVLAKSLAAGGGGDTDRFQTTGETLTSTLGYLSNTSGLVLDPDLDSYYLILALYEAVPSIVDDISGLLSFTVPGQVRTTLDNLQMYALAQDIGTTEEELRVKVDLSLRAVSRAWAPVPGYQEQVAPIVTALTSATADVLTEAEAQAGGTAKADPVSLKAKALALIPLLDQFHNVGTQALTTMIQGRIRAFETQLAEAFGTALAGLALGGVVFLLLGQSIRKRSSHLVQALGQLAEGDLTHSLDQRLLTSGDELGRLARSVQVLRDDLNAVMKSIAEVNDELGLMGSTLAATAEESASAIEQMAATSAHAARFAGTQLAQTKAAGSTVAQITQRISEANDLTMGMAGQFFMFSQAMEANRRRVQKTAAEARNTGSLAEDLNRAGSEGARSLEALRGDIEGVARRADEIQNIVQFILDIADRTNLLSMNAGIEAAHAGTSGRGFKVVADEIRKLAEVSGTQAQNIRALVDGINAAATQTLQKAESTRASFGTLGLDIEAVRNASQAIADQIIEQEAEDTKLSSGLEEFTRFYGDLSHSMETQVGQSTLVTGTLEQLEQSSRQIAESMDEQKIGMGQATEAVVQVRDTSTDVARILEELAELLARFRTGEAEVRR